MSKDKNLELVAKFSMVTNGGIIRPGSTFVAADEAEYQRFMERGEAMRPGTPVPPNSTRPETPESRKGSKLETRTPFDG